MRGTAVSSSKPGMRALTAVSAALAVVAEGAPTARLERALAALVDGEGDAALYRLDGKRFRAVAGVPSEDELDPSGSTSRRLRGGRASGAFLPLRVRGLTVGALELRTQTPVSARELKVVLRALALAVRRREAPVATDRQLVKAAAAATVGTLTPNLLHEISNSLFGMLGLVEITLAESEPGTKAHERLELARGSGLAMKETIRIFRELSSDRTARGEVALAETTHVCVELLRRVGACPDVELVEQSHGEATVIAKRADVKLAVAAMLLHVVRAASAGARVVVSVRRNERTATVAVVDEHEPEARAVAKESLFGTESPPELGLSAARSIARSLGGDLTVRTVEGGGAALRLTLPRVER